MPTLADGLKVRREQTQVYNPLLQTLASLPIPARFEHKSRKHFYMCDNILHVYDLIKGVDRLAAM